MEETMGALDQAVRSGKALYAGISMYNPEQTRQAAQIMRRLGTPLLIHQPNYSLLDRWIEGGLLEVLEEEGIGCIVFSPLAQGLLTNRYLEGIPADSRAGRGVGYLHKEDVRPAVVERVRRLNEVAKDRGQSMAQLALAWVLRQKGVTSALIGASRPAQVEDSLASLQKLDFSPDELQQIEKILAE
jgi:L-glyceraldehyde 3-phosphate reductase